MSAPRPFSFSRLAIALAIVVGMLLGAGVATPRDALHGAHAHSHECAAGEADCDRETTDGDTDDDRPSRMAHDHVHAPDHGPDGVNGIWVAMARAAYVDLRRPDTGSRLNKRDASGRLDRPPRVIFAV